MICRRLLSFALVATVLVGVSCKPLPRDVNVDKTSPNGMYRVKVAVRVQEEGDFGGHFTEQGKIQVFKGQETIYTQDWDYRDNWEPTFIHRSPLIEWVGDNILRMGEDRSDQPFFDEIVVLNHRDESLKHVGVSYGGYEQFTVLEIAPRGWVTLNASPRFKPDGSSNYYLVYGGETQGGKEFSGTLKEKQRKSPADRPLKFQIEIN